MENMNGILRHSYFSELMTLLAINSETGNVPGIEACFGHLARKADEFGFLHKFAANGKVLEIYPKGLKGIPKVGFLTHIDTVPIGEGWKHEAYGEIVKDEYGRTLIYGRGVLDDKGAALMSLYALHSVEKRISPTWKIIIGSTEETDMSDIKEYLEDGNIPPLFTVNIDGDGIQNGCRGSAIVEMTFDRKSKSKVLKEFYSVGKTANTLPSEVKMRYDGSTIKTIAGKAVHSSLPGGTNAIIKAAHWIPAGEFPTFTRFINNVKSMEYGKALFIDDYGFELDLPDELRTSVIPTMVKLEGDKLTLTVNVRISPRIVSKKPIMYGVRKSRTDYKCGVELKSLIMPNYTDHCDDQFKYMLEAYYCEREIRPEVTIARGTGYIGALGTPGAIFGPRFALGDNTDEDTCHMPDEMWAVEDMVRFYSMLKRYILLAYHK